MRSCPCRVRRPRWRIFRYLASLPLCCYRPSPSGPHPRPRRGNRGRRDAQRARGLAGRRKGAQCKDSGAHWRGGAPLRRLGECGEAAQAAPRLRPSRRERQGAPAKECPFRGARTGRQACRRFRDIWSKMAFGEAYSEFVHVPAAAGRRARNVHSTLFPHGMAWTVARREHGRVEMAPASPPRPRIAPSPSPSPLPPFFSPSPPPRLCGRTAAAGTPALPTSTDHRHATSESHAPPGGATLGT